MYLCFKWYFDSLNILLHSAVFNPYGRFLKGTLRATKPILFEILVAFKPKVHFRSYGVQHRPSDLRILELWCLLSEFCLFDSLFQFLVFHPKGRFLGGASLEVLSGLHKFILNLKKYLTKCPIISILDRFLELQFYLRRELPRNDSRSL